MNKTILILSIMILALATSALAVEQTIDEECQSFGFDFGIARWVWDGESFSEDVSIEGFDTNVEGDQDSFEWESDPDVTGVISREACNIQVTEGGDSGEVSSISDDVETITFCGDDEESEEEDFDGEVPEFGTITAIIVLFVAGIYITRKRK